MLNQLRTLQREYPRQFWLLFWGLLISTIGSSMIWPFLLIYVRKRLAMPADSQLTTIGSLMTINAGMGLLFSFVAGPVTDFFGRKWVMALSLSVNGLGYLLMSQAGTFQSFAILMALIGAFNPLYRVGADAMMADLVPPDKRADAYSLLRTSNNVGVALGPSIGGFLAVVSYNLAFYSAAAGLILYSLLVAFFATETLSKRADAAGPRSKEPLGGYLYILRDRPFISFAAAFTLTQICAALIWILLGPYANQNFHVPENLYGLIPTTNALMVVFFQFLVTRYTKRRPPLHMLALGALFYALGTGSVALGRGFGGFWTSMVIVTIGELIVSPIATTMAANLAPADMRGRYMSLYGLTWGVAAGIGPMLGGLLNDRISPVSIWYGGLLVGLASVTGFWLLSNFSRRQSGPQAPAAETSLNSSGAPHLEETLE